MFKTRRDMLKLLGIAPFLAPAFRDVLAEGSASPKRAIFYLFHNGIAPEYWFPQGGNAGSMNLAGTSLESLADYKQKVLIFQNLRNTVGTDATPNYTGDHHVAGANSILAAQNGYGGIQNKGISLDQHIANKMKFPTQRQSILLGFKPYPTDGSVMTVDLFKSKGSPADILKDPYDAINSIFGNFMAPGVMPQSSTAVSDLEQRKSILDAIHSELNTLSGRLASPEKSKLESHLSLVRSAELAIGQGMRTLPGAGGGSAAMCSKLTAPANQANSDDIGNFITVGKLQMDLIAMAMACDISRVFAFQAMYSYTNFRGRWFGYDIDMHLSVNHSKIGDANRPIYGEANKSYASLFGYLLQKLDSVKEGNGTLLDNSIAMMGSEYGGESDGNNHNFGDLPVVLAGGTGFLKTGQVLNAGDKSHTQVLGGIMKYFGIDRSAAPSASGDGDFGDGGYDYSPFPGMLV